MSHKLALSSPLSPIGLTLDLRLTWSELLREKGYGVQNLPAFNKMFRTKEDWEEHTSEVMQSVGGLVLATFNKRHIELDNANAQQIKFAEDNSKPVFIQSPLSEVSGRVIIPEGVEIIEIGSNIELIAERLGE
jgi:hypothetical protein